jgi:hypothetical protein
MSYLRRKTEKDYPERDLTPEHTKRGDSIGNTDIDAANKYVGSVIDTSDFLDQYLWHGWALREAFLAGISYAEKK